MDRNSGLLISERTTPFWGDFSPLPHRVSQVTPVPFAMPGEPWPCAHLLLPTMVWKAWATGRGVGLEGLRNVFRGPPGSGAVGI